MCFLLDCNPPRDELRLELGGGSQWPSEMFAPGGDEMTYGFNERVFAVNNAVDGWVHCIVNTLEGVFPVWVVPRFF